MTSKITSIQDNVLKHLNTITADVFALVAVLFIHSATIPTLVAVLYGLTDNLPTVDMVLLTWAGLVALLLQSIVQKKLLITISISLGFVVQAALLALIFFK